MTFSLPSGHAAAQPYRPDIDGLRALAVLAVVVGHAFEAYLPGGFLGVDVFFVISGYVITLSLVGRGEAGFGRFLAAFFLRRIKRLMPALLVCFLVVSCVLLAIDREPEASLITGALSLVGLSNFALHAQALDYFSASIRYNAFTHTWSLGVEEQFYLLFPVLFWLVFAPQRQRRAKALGLVVAGLSVVSLAAFVALQDSAESLAYYMMPFRFWELGVGVAAAVWSRSPGAAGHPLSALLALAGLAAVFALAGPGVMAGHVAAVLLTAVLLTGGAGAARRPWVLTNPFSVYVGRISYSLYLWHWPFLTFGLLAPTQPIASPGVAIVCAFGAAVLSYHLVEQPVRHLRTPVPRVRHFATAFGAVFASVAVIAGANDLRRERAEEIALNPYPPNFLPLPGGGGDHDPTCVVDGQRRLLTPETFARCTFPPTEPARPMLWVMGDSHAGHLQGGLIHLRETHGVGFHLVETPGTVFPVPEGREFAARDHLVAQVRDNWKPGDVVVLSRLYVMRDAEGAVAPDVPGWMAQVDRLASSLREAGVDLVLMGPPPAYRFEDIRACDPAERLGCGVPREELAPVMAQVHDMLAGIAARHENVAVVRSFDLLCPRSVPVCVPAPDGVFLYRDRDHVNVAGAKVLAEGLLEALERLR